MANELSDNQQVTPGEKRPAEGKNENNCLEYMLFSLILTFIFLLDDSSQGNTKKKKSNVRNINIDDKNPISILNELRFGLKYNFIEQSGPPHNPMFKVSVEVDGQTYFGGGNSKKAAKAEAATEALKSFIQFPSNGTIISVNRTSSNKMDFTSDQIVDKDKALKLAKSKITKGPLMLLNELYPNAEFTCVNNESDPYARFKFTIKIRNESYTGSGKYSY